MPVNKVDLSTGETLIDLTGDSVTPETLAEGVTAHNAAGAQIVGTMTAGTTFTLTATTTPGATVTATLGGLTVTADADASGTAVLTLPEGGTWLVRADYDGQTIAEESVPATFGIEVVLLDVSTVFNDNDWPVVAIMSNTGGAGNLWSIGDRKGVLLSGTVGHLVLSNFSCYAFILGFNHNWKQEGNGRTHLQLAKTSIDGGADIAFCDTLYNSQVNNTGYFSMNTGNSNAGGWELSQMRTNICGTNLSSNADTIISIIPEDLRAVLKPVVKYTDNTGNSSDESAVTATNDYFFLLSEYEVFGSISIGNPNEASWQKQYDYYAAGNSKTKNNHQSQTTKVLWKLRSPNAGNATGFVSGNTNEAAAGHYAGRSAGFAPGFCV